MRLGYWIKGGRSDVAHAASALTAFNGTRRGIPMSRLCIGKRRRLPGGCSKAPGRRLYPVVHSRYDGAGYLAGYVVECSLKSVILLGGQNARKYRHDLNRLSTGHQAGCYPNRKTARYASSDARTSMYAAPTGGAKRCDIARSQPSRRGCRIMDSRSREGLQFNGRENVEGRCVMTTCRHVGQAKQAAVQS